MKTSPQLDSSAPFLHPNYNPFTAGLMNPHHVRTAEQWIDTYKNMGAYWMFDYTLPYKSQRHARLTSGKCSDMFFDSGGVSSQPMRQAEAVRDLFFHLGTEMPHVLSASHRPTRFVGPAVGAITFAHDAARISSEVPGWSEFSAMSSFAEKTDTGDNLCFMRTKPTGTDLVVACEDVFTTGGSLQKLLNQVKQSGADIAPYAFVLVNRNGMKEFAGLRIISLITQKTNVWEPDVCPLCDAGSRPVHHPKKNWQELTRIG